MPLAETTAGKVHYDLRGADLAPVLMFSNSLGTDISLWDGQLAALSSSFRILRYDTRGHGTSPCPPGDYTITELTRDAIELLDRLAIPRVHFCGLSMGGMIGMSLAAHHPTRVDHLILANTGAFMGPPDGWNSRIATIRQGGMAAIVDAVMERWFTPAFRQSASEAVSKVRNVFLHTPAEGYTACCAAIRDMDQRASLAAINARTLVIGGSHDPATPPELTRQLAAAIPSAKYIEFPAAHLSNIECPDAFNAALREFLPA